MALNQRSEIALFIGVDISLIANRRKWFFMGTCARQTEFLGLNGVIRFYLAYRTNYAINYPFYFFLNDQRSYFRGHNKNKTNQLFFSLNRSPQKGVIGLFFFLAFFYGSIVKIGFIHSSGKQQEIALERCWVTASLFLDLT